jgi:hypothetical protein
MRLMVPGTLAAIAMAILIVKMNTLLKTLAVLFAVALPTIVAADFTGLTLPSFINVSYTFIGFGLTVGLLTVTADYRQVKPLAVGSGCRQPARTSSSLPLAA